MNGNIKYYTVRKNSVEVVLTPDQNNGMWLNQKGSLQVLLLQTVSI